LVIEGTQETVHVDDDPKVISTITNKWLRGKGRGNFTQGVVAHWLALRAVDPEIRHKDAAKLIGVHERTLYRALSKAAKEGWLKFDNVLERIEHEIIPKTLDNLNSFLDERDRTVTIEAAKGVIFKPYQEAKGVGDSPRNILALKIEIAPSSDATIQVGGNVFGKPKEIIDTYAIQVGEAKTLPLDARAGSGQEMGSQVRQQANGGSEKSSQVQEEGQVDV